MYSNTSEERISYFNPCYDAVCMSHQFIDLNISTWLYRLRRSAVSALKL